MQASPSPALLPVYNRAPLVIERGEGAYLIAEDGERYLDFAAGIAVNSLGHGHHHLVEALTDQARVLWHCSNLYRTRIQETFAERLAAASFADTAFFTNSGAEAVECGIKMIRRFQSAQGMSRPRILVAEGAFHGRSFACISAGGSPRATKGYEPLLGGFDRVPFGDLEALQSAVTARTGGILLETILGEGGVREASAEYWQGVHALADREGLLLFLDEVQCGMGRTGTLFAFERYGIAPDICSLAKGIGGGFPLGACLATKRAGSFMEAGSHGGTYGGNPLAMAAGNAVLDVLLAPGFLDGVTRIGVLFKNALVAIAGEFPDPVAEVRGVGLMLGMRFRRPAREVVECLRAERLLAVASSEDNVVRFMPPLTITEAEAEEAAQKIRRALEKMP